MWKDKCMVKYVANAMFHGVLPSLRGCTVSGIPMAFNMNCTFTERS